MSTTHSHHGTISKKIGEGGGSGKLEATCISAASLPYSLRILKPQDRDSHSTSSSDSERSNDTQSQLTSYSLDYNGKDLVRTSKLKSFLDEVSNMMHTQRACIKIGLYRFGQDFPECLVQLYSECATLREKVMNMQYDWEEKCHSKYEQRKRREENESWCDLLIRLCEVYKQVC